MSLTAHCESLSIAGPEVRPECDYSNLVRCSSTQLPRPTARVPASDVATRDRHNKMAKSTRGDGAVVMPSDAVPSPAHPLSLLHLGLARREEEEEEEFISSENWRGKHNSRVCRPSPEVGPVVR